MADIKGRLHKVLSGDHYATAVVASATFTDTFLYSVIVPIFPRLLSTRFGVPPEQIQRWTSISLGLFGAGLVSCNVIAGYVTHRVGSSSRIPFLSGLIFMGIATVLLFFGTNVASLAIARLLQGASGAFVWVSGFAYLTNHVDPSYVPFAVGIVTAGASCGDLVAPIAGGALYQQGGRIAVAILCLAVLCIDLVLRLLLQQKEKHNASETPNERDRLLPDGATVEAGAHDAGKANDTSSYNEDGSVRRRVLITSWIAIFVAGMARSALEAALPLFVAKEYHWNSASTGGVIFALVCPALAATLVTEYASKRDVRLLLTGFFVLEGAAFIGYAFVQQNIVGAKIGFIIATIAIGTAWAVVTNACIAMFSREAKRSQSAESSKDESGSLFGAMSMAWALSMMLGPVIPALLVDFFGWSCFVFVFAALSLMMAVVMAVF